MRGINSLHF